MLTRKRPPMPSREDRCAALVAAAAPSTGARMATPQSLARLSVMPKSQPARHDGYLRLVAHLPCIYCGIEGHTRAAHSNTGKGMATKADDRGAFPLCADRPGQRGCHSMLDQGALMGKTERQAVEPEWARRTRQTINALGLWPLELDQWPEDEKTCSA